MAAAPHALIASRFGEPDARVAPKPPTAGAERSALAR
jgi:hypothetical protein